MPAVILAAGFFISLFTFSVTVKAEPLPANSKRLTIVAMDKVYEFSYPEIDYYNGEYYLKRASEMVDGIFSDTVVRPVDAYYTADCSAEKPFTYHIEKYGKGIDKKKLENAIRRVLNGNKSEIIAETVDIAPSITVEQLKLRTALLSEFTTSYRNSATPRKNNIKLAATLIGCIEIRDGLEFSFNNVVGERSKTRGFSSAVVIENGKFVEGVGGGVCQVSSTVYACAVKSGMTITERKRHTLLVSYTLPSFDAMVSDGSSDLRFKNESGNTVTLIVDADGDRVRARIFGVKSNREYKFVSELIEYVEPPETKIIETDSLTIGEYSPMVIPKRGAKSKAYLETYENKKLIGKKLLSYDVYSPLGGIILKGKG